MVVEDAVSTTDGGLSITPWIESKANPRSSVEQVTGHASDRHTAGTTANHPIERVAGVGDDGAALTSHIAIHVVYRRRVCSHPFCGIEIIGVLVLLAIGSKQTDAKTEVQCQPASSVKIVLEVGFDNFVAVVILGLCARLTEAENISQQKVGKRIATRVRRCGVEVQEAVGRRLRCAKFVFLGESCIGTELQVVIAYHFGDVVTIGICRIRVVGAIGNVSGVLSKTITINSAVAATHTETRQFASVVGGRKKASGVIAGGALPCICIGRS